MDILKSGIQNLNPISQKSEAVLLNSLNRIEVPKGEIVLNEGKISKNLYFVERGCLRGFYNLDGKEITHWFGFEGDLVTSFRSFILQKESIENIQAVEDSILWSISYLKLMYLYDLFSDIERLGRIACEKYYVRLEERYVNAQFKTAHERYSDLMENMPQIINRVPLGFIASYLGVSQETLSRIRARRI